MALVLSRKTGETIQIGSNIFVTVAEIRGDKIRLAVTAPREIPVHRAEIQRKIDEEECNAKPETTPE